MQIKRRNNNFFSLSRHSCITVLLDLFYMHYIVKCFLYISKCKLYGFSNANTVANTILCIKIWRGVQNYIKIINISQRNQTSVILTISQWVKYIHCWFTHSPLQYIYYTHKCKWDVSSTFIRLLKVIMLVEGIFFI